MSRLVMAFIVAGSVVALASAGAAPARACGLNQTTAATSGAATVAQTTTKTTTMKPEGGTGG